MTPTTTASPKLPAVVSLTDNKLIMRGRIKNSSDLQSIHQTLFNADWEASRKRAIVQDMADGGAPYSTSHDALHGMMGRANINFGQLADALTEAEMPYTNLLESLDTFGTAPTHYGDEETRIWQEPIIAEELARMIKSWPSFFPSWQLNAHLFKMEGISFCFHEDDIDWRWKVKGLQYFKFPRETPADIEQLDLITAQEAVYPHELFQKIEAESNLPEGEPKYWDRQAVIQAIKGAAPVGLDLNDWEAVQRAWKDNDLYWGLTQSPMVKIIHGWVKELDGTITHLISTYQGEGNFLYKCEGKFTRMASMLTAYTDGIGTNGDFHSIRGLGYKLFPAASGQNRLRCKMLDLACIEATPFLSSPSEDAITDRSITPMGPFMVLENKAQFTTRAPTNVQQNLVPVMQMIDGVYNGKSAASAPVATSQSSRTQKTKYQVQTETEQQGTLLSGGFFLFMSAWERHYKNVVRRVINPDYLPTDPGGEAVHSFRLRCLKRGVPMEAIDKLDVEAIQINMGVGKGSIGERRVVLDTLNSVIYDRLDQKGRQILDRATVASYTNAAFANLLIPDQPGTRPPIDAQIAKMENSVMSMGQPPAFEVNQDHVVHVETHLERLYEINTQLEERAIELRPAIDQMQPIWEHCIQDHMPLISPQNPDHARFKEALQQLGELITNSRKHLDAEDAKAQEDAEVEGAMAEETPAGMFRSAVDANTRAALPDQVIIEKERAKIAQDAEELRMKTEAHNQDKAIKDVKLALEVKKANAPAPAKKTA